MEGTILIIFYGFVSLLLVSGGVFAIWAGQSLFRQGVGLKKEGSSFEAENKIFKIKATASTVGGTLMLTAWLWGYFAMQNLPSLEDKESGITISSLANEGISFEELAATDMEPIELAELDASVLASSTFQQTLANARDNIVQKQQQIEAWQQAAVATDTLKEENATLNSKIEKFEAQLAGLPDYQSHIESLEKKLRELLEENDRLKSGPKDSCGEVLFRFDRDNICEVIKEEVTEALGAIVDQNPVAIEVNGHTDPLGSEEYNLNLGQRRADNVANLLVRLGIARNIITITSFGERFAEESSRDEHWRSRKVIIKVKHSQH